MKTAREIAEKWFPSPEAGIDTDELELDILRLFEHRYGDGIRPEKWAVQVTEHAHQWEDEFLAIIGPNSITSGGNLLVCRICGARKNKYQTY